PAPAPQPAPPQQPVTPPPLVDDGRAIEGEIVEPR
ncbi:FxsA family protein, partial [Verrucosispora sp. SN26_14.1]